MSRQSELAELGRVYATAPLSNRNLIINGAMQVAQRGTSFTGLANSPVYNADRFEFRRINSWSTGRFAVTQESDGPAGFAKSIKLATTTAETDTTSIASLSTRLEGFDCQSLKYGSSSAESITLSFWVKSYQTGTYSFVLNVANLNQSIYGALYTINQSGTWEYKTITIPAPALAATTAINNDNAQGLELIWHFTYRDSAGTLTNNSWDETTGSATLRWYSVNGQTINGSTSTSNYIQLTGVQLEVGDTATPFEHRSYGDEYLRCARYYYKPTTDLYGNAYDASNGMLLIDFPASMRATPTVGYTARRSNVTTYDFSSYNCETRAQLYFSGGTDADRPYVEGTTFDAEL